jgi:HD-like signal output (HDOD) protein
MAADKAAIASTERVSMQTLTLEHAAKILGGVAIPPRPEALTAVQQESQRPEPDLARLARCIAGDVGLAAAVLKTINSPYYGLSRRIVNVDQAVSLLGLRNIGVLVTGFCLRSNLPSGSMERFWDSATRQAAIMSYLARTLGCAGRDEAHLYGLFHDCGIPILMQRFPDYKQTLAAANKERERSFTDVEDARHSTNHAVVGALLANNWGLAPELREATRLHHDLTLFSSQQPPAILNLVALGILAEFIESGYSRLNGGSEWLKLGEAVMTHLMLDEGQLETLRREACDVLDESGL